VRRNVYRNVNTTDDLAKKSTDYIQEKAIGQSKKVVVKMATAPIAGLKQTRKIKIHKEQIKTIQGSNRSEIPLVRTGDLVQRRERLLTEREQMLYKSKKLKTSLSYLDVKEEKLIKKETATVGRDPTKELHKNETSLNEKKKEKLVQRSKFDSPLTSKTVTGKRNFAQKTVTSPIKAISSTGASVKDSFNREIEESDTGIQLANQMISPVATKVSFESNKLIARKVGFDRKAYQLEKTEKKIVKIDKKLAKEIKGKRKKIRKEAAIQSKLVGGNSMAISKSFQMRSFGSMDVSTSKAIEKLVELIKLVKNLKVMAIVGGAACLLLIPSLIMTPLMALGGGGFMGMIGVEKDSSSNLMLAGQQLNSDVLQWESAVRSELKNQNLLSYLDLVLVIIQLESSGNGEKTPDIMQSSESQGWAMNTIDNPTESIKYGVKHLNSLLKEQEKYDVDMKTVIHSYNYGIGFISYVASNGGKWTQELANSFSSIHAEKMGWSSYGDPSYVEKAMRYLSFNGEDVSLVNVEFDLEGKKLPYPVPGFTTISSHYSRRVHPITGVEHFHLGTDFPAPTGTSVIAVADGVVSFSGWMNSYGYVVMIQHAGNVVTVYAHNSKLLVRTEETVKAGQVISQVGSTGDSTGAHLHFEVRKDNNYTNPVSWLK